MREFLSVVSAMIGQLDQKGKYEPGMVQRMKDRYLVLSEEEKTKSLQILDEILQENYQCYFWLMSTLLFELEDGRILEFLKHGMVFKEYPLWERFGNLFQLKKALFDKGGMHISARQQYNTFKPIYEDILDELQEKLGAVYPYTPYSARKKTIVIVTPRVNGLEYAPTKKLVRIYGWLERLGYNVKVFVCFYPGKIRNDNTFWYQPVRFYNFLEKTTAFEYEIADVKMEGYNLVLQPQNYLKRLREAVGMIWDEKPEYVFELGDETMLAGLCSHFTTVVTMACTKSVPITNAPIIARYFDYSQEENETYFSYLDEEQKVVDVKHIDIDFFARDSEKKMKKQDFGIPEEKFVVVIAGNRLEDEVSGEFLNVIFEVLEKGSQYVIAFIGECPKLSRKLKYGEYADRLFFLGYAEDFRGAIAIGDVFLNPPRQGGGTGGTYAILEKVPVITLDDCDVESSVGKEFVCKSLAEMPSLVVQYCSDSEFRLKQKEHCKNRANQLASIDNVGSFQKLCRFVGKATLKREKNHET